MSDAAPQRIRRFSIGVWIIGTIAVAITSFVVLPTIVADPVTGEVLVIGEDEDGYRDYPWFDPDPDEYEIVDGVIHGTAQGGFLRLDAGAELMMLTTDDDAQDGILLYQQLDTELDPEAEGWDPGGFVGSLYPDSQSLIMPGAEDGLLWFGRSAGEWTVTVTTPETTTMGESASGDENAVLLYEGDALSGRFQHTGDGLFIVEAVTVGGWQLLVNEFDEVDVRTSWEPTDRVALFVSADTGEGSWTITLDTPASDPATTATPTP